jgi:hypothetical protein
MYKVYCGVSRTNTEPKEIQNESKNDKESRNSKRT